MPRPVNIIPPQLPAVVNDVELMPPIVVPLTNGREESRMNSSTQLKLMFSLRIFILTLFQNWDTHINTSDGSDIMIFGQHTFSTEDPTVYYDQPLQGSFEQHGHHQLYAHTSGADVHVYVSESDNDSSLVSDHQFWSNFFTPNISRHIYQGVIGYSVTLGVNKLDIVDQLPVKPRETRPTQMDHEAMKPFFTYLPTSCSKKSFETCFHHMCMPPSGYLRRRHKSPNPAANFYHCSEIHCTDTIFGDVPLVNNGATAAQLLVGLSSKFTTVHALKGLTEEDILLTLQDRIRNHGAPEHITANNAAVYRGPKFWKYLCDLWIRLWQSESYKQNQNYTKNRWQPMKVMINRLLYFTSAPKYL